MIITTHGFEGVCFYKAARFLEQDIAALDRADAFMIGDPPSNNHSQEHDHVHAQVSRKLDQYSHSNRLRTDHSILVTLLYVLMVLTLASSLASFGIRC